MLRWQKTGYAVHSEAGERNEGRTLRANPPTRLDEVARSSRRFLGVATTARRSRCHRRALIGLGPQSSSDSRLTASPSGFFILIQYGDRPDR